MRLSIIVLVFFYGTFLLHITVTDSSCCFKNNKRTETIKQHVEPVHVELDPQFAVEPVSTAPRKIFTEKLTKVKSHLYESILKYLNFDSLDTYTYMQVILHYKPKFHLPKINDDVTFHQYLNFLREIHHHAYQDFTIGAKFKRWAELCRVAYLSDDSILIPYHQTTNGSQQQTLFFDFLWVKANVDGLSFEEANYSKEEFVQYFRTEKISCQNLLTPIHKLPILTPMMFLFTFDDQYIPPQIKFVSDLVMFQYYAISGFYPEDIALITDLCQHRIKIEFRVYNPRFTYFCVQSTSINGYERNEYYICFKPYTVINDAARIYKYSFENFTKGEYRFDQNQGQYRFFDQKNHLRYDGLTDSEKQKNEFLRFKDIYIKYFDKPERI